MNDAINDVLNGKRPWHVHLGDNREVLDFLSGLKLNVDHTITDPPFEAEAHTLQRRVIRKGDGNATDDSGGRVANVEALKFPPLTEEQRIYLGMQFGKITRRWCLVFGQVEAAVRWAASLEGGGHVYKRTCIWVKPDAQPQLSGDRPAMGYETFVASHSKGRSKWNGGGKSSVYIYNKMGPLDRTRSGHPTQKPIRLMLELISDFTNPGDLVFDPFTGSGTTGIAAVALGRRFLGCEIDPEYHAMSMERIEAESKGLNVDSMRANQAPMFDADAVKSKKPPPGGWLKGE